MGGSALSTKNTVGTYHWMAPEVLRGKNGITEKCDVFSVGVILCESSPFLFLSFTFLILVFIYVRLCIEGEIATNTEPWKEIREPVAIISIVAMQNRRLPIPSELQPELKTLIADCWNTKPELRPTMQEVLDRLSLLPHITPCSINEQGVSSVKDVSVDVDAEFSRAMTSSQGNDYNPARSTSAKVSDFQPQLVQNAWGTDQDEDMLNPWAVPSSPRPRYM